ncbi:phenylalanyl-tRNA synthetase beta subunit [Austwickia chelonae]|uniref:Phenylalanine--tRNA ligase beta subunit n=1 Tax=Austwickia chelonae NBRC 105200 TaxID=1184607 RepID=K6V333_9MICO|nr:phenylalanine--tRNA ligase subunit beta [Austwickia chelonae]GAB76448.1 phenylalanine--tRNA ligase beta subunit [Austwickia chelonae NBRC 105200]SEW24859.1 phenylalanyl-tRNA synthetase beta subunit [Austwickia chelonae]
MRAPTSWLAELVGLDHAPAGIEVAADLVRVGLEEEAIHVGEVTGPLVVGRVLDKTDEPQENGKTIHFCHVDIGTGTPQEIVCGAHNFDAGDLVVVILPGGRLGDFEIGARKTYGHMSAGMICSEKELGLGEDHDGIIVLTEFFAGDESLISSLAPGQDALDLLGLSEEVVEVNVTPDRGYCLSMRGIAREYALSTGRGVAFQDPVVDGDGVPGSNDEGYEVRLVDETRIHGVAGCDRYVARMISGIDVATPTPPWMKRRLRQMGMRPVNVVVDVTNYVMLLTGQPLHAFDLDTLGGAIEVRRAREGESLVTLDGVKRLLHPQDLLITDGGNTPLAIAGVMGGQSCEVTLSTTNILVEAAHFDPVSIARSSRRHQLSTEASRRFERGVDPAVTAAVADMTVRMLLELAGGQLDPGVTDIDRREGRYEITFDTAQAWRLIEPGNPLTSPVPDGLGHQDVVAELRGLGCEVEEITEPAADAFGHVRVSPPSWRPDLRNGPDLVEEIARLRGYDRIPSILPDAPGGRGLTRAQIAVRTTNATLAALGLSEVWSYPFVSERLFDDLGYTPDDARRQAVRITNPLSDEAPLLRTSILDSLLGTLRLNVNRGSKDCAVFETGLVFRSVGDLSSAPVPAVGVRPDPEVLDAIVSAVPSQPRHVAFAMTGSSEPQGPYGAAVAWTAPQTIGLAISLARVFGVVVMPESETGQAPWHPGRCARLVAADGSVIGYAGELHPKVCARLGVPPRSCAAELDLDELLSCGGDPVQASMLSTYPVAHTDVALVVDEDTPSAAVESALRAGAGHDLESVDLFDVYRGEQVGGGQKSLAYRLTFRAADRTLTTDEVSGARDAAIAAAAQVVGAVQRG